MKKIRSSIRGRPKPTIFLNDVVNNARSIQVIKCNDLYAVFYDDDLISVRYKIDNKKDPNNHIAYPRMAWSFIGQALTAAEKLNKRFNTDKFVVRKMNKGKIVIKEE